MFYLFNAHAHIFEFVFKVEVLRVFCSCSGTLKMQNKCVLITAQKTLLYPLSNDTRNIWPLSSNFCVLSFIYGSVNQPSSDPEAGYSLQLFILSFRKPRSSPNISPRLKTAPGTGKTTKRTVSGY